MNEFIYNNLGFLNKLLEFIAALTGLIVYYKYKQTTHKYFICFLCYVFILEAIGGYTVYVYKYEWLSQVEEYLSHTWMRRNSWWYTIFWTIGSTLFYSFYFRNFLISKTLRAILKYLSYTFIVFALIIIGMRWNDFFVTSLLQIRIFATSLTVLSIVFYLMETLKSERILKFHKTLNVYISLSVFIWTVITAPLAFFSGYMIQEDMSYVYLRTNVILFANVFLYISFTVGLIVSKSESNINIEKV